MLDVVAYNLIRISNLLRKQNPKEVVGLKAVIRGVMATTTRIQGVPQRLEADHANRWEAVNLSDVMSMSAHSEGTRYWFRWLSGAS
jgi:hypothetical protein